MASNSETGHNKNVANFSTAYQILEEMGTLYNPSNAKIQLVNLDPIRASLQTVITELNNKKPIYKNGSPMLASTVRKIIRKNILLVVITY